MKLWCYMDTHYCPASSEFSMSTEDFLKPDGSGLQIGQNSSPKSKGQICPHSSQHIHLSIGLSQILHIFINNYSISLSVCLTNIITCMIADTFAITQHRKNIIAEQM